MSAAHTPGPWSITSAGFDETCDSNDACYYIAASGGMEVSKANACLIAAAPELLDGGEELLARLDTSIGSFAFDVADSDFQRGYLAALKAVREEQCDMLVAAIAKARGDV